MKFKKFRNAIFAVAYSREGDNIKYLLLKRKKHWIGWEFPKGGIDFFERIFLSDSPTSLRSSSSKFFGRYLRYNVILRGEFRANAKPRALLTHKLFRQSKHIPLPLLLLQEDNKQ